MLTSPDKRTLGEQYVSAIAPAQASAANPFSNGKLEVISDANLTTANPWYLFADPALDAEFVYGYLTTEPGIRMATRAGFEVEGVEMRIALDFGVGAAEARAAYKNAGAGYWRASPQRGYFFDRCARSPARHRATRHRAVAGRHLLFRDTARR